jgi:hypothetical protein
METRQNNLSSSRSSLQVPRYVAEWPWDDFLQGKFVCRSITELADVAGAHRQMILLYLREFKNT